MSDEHLDQDARTTAAWRAIADAKSGNPNLTIPRNVLAELIDVAERGLEARRP